ncbi:MULTISPECIES: hypothetical protein [unclassified Streptomyces]|uniref:hypothetical protein n=1 Tax=unclassified Streptomyces TaxID=2593676 RepID=UPI0036E1B182
MDLAALRDADFSLLDDAVSDWATMVKDLETLKEDAEKGLRSTANKANWAGYNATVSKEFIGKTSGEVADAHTQAHSIYKILQDTRDELKSYQKHLLGAIDRAGQQNLTVVSSEGSFTVTSNTRPDWASDPSGKNGAVDQKVVDQFRDEIQKILDKATESDSTANSALVAIADQSELGFSDADYSSRDEASKALKDAENLADLAKQKPEELSPKEFDQLNKGLKEHAGDPLFAERFTTRLGAEGTLDFWAGLNDPHSAWKVGQERVDQYAALQKNLSLTLATASQSDTTDMTTWKSHMVDLVDKPVGRSGGFPLGGQVMSNLMRWGDYDDRFLVDYGDKLIETEKKFTDNGRHGAWTRIGADPLLNRTGTDSGWDPMTGYLKALSNSPDAATEFFNDTFVTKDEDHDFTHDTDDGKQGRRALSNFDYLFEERDWPEDVDDKGEESIAGRNYMAAALEAATTGHPAGEMPTIDTPPHNAEQAKLMESLVASIGDDPGRLTQYGYMSDSVGQITSEYLPDINRAISDVKRDTESPAWQDIAKLYPVSGSEAKLAHTDVTKLLFAVGQNPEGYAAVEVGQKAYMGKLLDYHLNPDLPSSLRVPDSNEMIVQQIASRSGEVSGTLGLGAQEAIGSEASNKDKEYEHSVAQRKNWISGGVGTVVGVGTSFIATPWVGALVGGGAGTVTSVVLESVFQDAEGNALDDAKKTGGQFWEDGKERTMTITENAARTAVNKYNPADSQDLDSVAREETRQGYLNARLILEGEAPGSTTDFS